MHLWKSRDDLNTSGTTHSIFVGDLIRLGCQISKSQGSVSLCLSLLALQAEVTRFKFFLLVV